MGYSNFCVCEVMVVYVSNESNLSSLTGGKKNQKFLIVYYYLFIIIYLKFTFEFPEALVTNRLAF